MHPTLSRFISRLSGHSTAKTPGGILSFLKSHPGILTFRESRNPKPRTRAEWDTELAARKWACEPARNDFLASKAIQVARTNNPRKQNWATPCPRVYPVALGSVFTESFRYKGRHSGRTGAIYHAEYNSYFRVCRNSGRVCEYYADNVLQRRRMAPKGLRFEVDSLGARIVDIASGLDYHFDLAEFDRPDFAAYIRKQLAAKKRKKAEALREFRKARELEKTLKNPKKLARVWVTRDDSLDSGNCQAGTDRFIETAFRDSQGIGAARADWLLEKWPSPAVVSAVRRALLRSAK